MIWSRLDTHWKLWTWQRFQQLLGAAIVITPAGYFLYCMTQGSLPADFHHDISVVEDDHRIIDNNSIGYAIGSCRLSGDISTWSPDWRRTLHIVEVHQSGGSLAAPASSEAVVQPHEQELTAFERAALWQSSRILQERTRFLREAEERQDRARRNQLRILGLSAAGAFLVALRSLVASKEEQDAPFRSLTKGALLPISILALLMPVLATVVSGVATFDGDPNVVVRDVRTLSQLEQLHGRVAEDVTSDPFLCPIMRAANVLYRGNDPTVQVAAGSSTIDPVKFNQCLMDRMARTVAWEQRHEQILNDATPALAHAGDLPRPADAPKPARQTVEASEAPLGDICQAAFGSATAASHGARTAKEAAAAPQKS
jgi:hypothetical protein